MKSKIYFFLCFALLPSMLFISCNPVWEDGAPYEIAIPDGTYLVEAIPTGETIPARTICASDDSRPVLSALVASSANMNQLTKFGEITANTLTITILGNTITKVWARDATLSTVFPNANTAFPSGKTTCTATWTGTITSNSGTTFQEAGAYTIAWSPTNCEMEIHNYATTGGSYGTGAWIPIFRTSFFTTSTSTTELDEWEVSRDGNTYTLTMPETIAAAQTQYSCPESNAIKMIWTKQ